MKTSNAYIISLLALSLGLTACGQGFSARNSKSVSNDQSNYLFHDFLGEFDGDDSDQEAVQSLASNPELQDDTRTENNEELELGMKPITLNGDAQERIMEKYKYVDPQHLIAAPLKRQALLFYFVNGQKFPNTDVLTIIDYSLPSSAKRLYVIEMKTGRVWNTYVAHGSGSDKNHDGKAEGFSNRKNSNATSLGPFMTMSPYQGGHGLSLRLKGLGKNNSNALSRNVVIHGARYVQDSSTRQGRSWGCIAVAPEYVRKLISTVKGGSLIYSGVSSPEDDHEF